MKKFETAFIKFLARLMVTGLCVSLFIYYTINQTMAMLMMFTWLIIGVGGLVFVLQKKL